jgi:hypothetical protein
MFTCAVFLFCSGVLPVIATAAPGTGKYIAYARTVAVDQAILGAHWSLVNLLLTIAAVILALILLTSLATFRRRRMTYWSSGSMNFRRLTMRIASLVSAALAVVVFLLTEDIVQPMVLFDIWTITHFAIVAVQLVFWAFFVFSSGSSRNIEPSKMPPNSRPGVLEL